MEVELLLKRWKRIVMALKGLTKEEADRIVMAAYCIAIFKAAQPAGPVG